MIILLKIVLIISLGAIAYQDIKERKVYLWLLLITFFLIGFLHYQQRTYIQFFITSLINIVIVLTIVTILFLYTKFKLKLPIKETFGLGDFLFFLILAIGFPTITFVVLFSFSLFFSLLLFLLLKRKLTQKTVPLAGLQALFFVFIFLLNWITSSVNLYQY